MQIMHLSFSSTSSTFKGTEGCGGTGADNFWIGGEQTFLWYFQCCFWHFMEQYLTSKHVEHAFVPTLVQPYMAQTMTVFTGGGGGEASGGGDCLDFMIINAVVCR